LQSTFEKQGRNDTFTYAGRRAGSQNLEQPGFAIKTAGHTGKAIEFSTEKIDSKTLKKAVKKYCKNHSILQSLHSAIPRRVLHPISGTKRMAAVSEAGEDRARAQGGRNKAFHRSRRGRTPLSR